MLKLSALRRGQRRMPLRFAIFLMFVALTAVTAAKAPATAEPRLGLEVSLKVQQVSDRGLGRYDAGQNLKFFKQMPLERILERLRLQRYTNFRRITVRRGVYRIRCTKYGYRYKLFVDAYTGRIIRIRQI